MQRILQRALVLGLLVVASCTAAAQTQQDPDPGIFTPIVGASFPADPMKEMLETKDIAAIIRQYRIVAGLKDVSEKTYGCRVGFRDWPCRRKRVLDVEFPVGISDVLPIRSDQKQKRALYIDSPEPGPYDAFLLGPTPPPTPYGILDARDLARVRGMIDAGSDGLYDEDGYALKARAPRAPTINFDADAVEWALRNLLWQGIENYTSFAPVDRVLHGRKALEAIKAVAAGGHSECNQDCPVILRRVLGADDTIYSYCIKSRFEGLELPSLHCTPIAFVVDSEPWLRTRLVYGVADGRGAGPFEVFQCVSEKSVVASVSALTEMFRARYKSETRTRKTGSASQLVAVSWRDRVSEVAANRWEIFFFDGVVQSEGAQSNRRKKRTVLEYQLPIYKLSDSRPLSVDAGLTPRDEIVRSFERALRDRLTAALAPAICFSKPVEGSMP